MKQALQILAATVFGVSTLFFGLPAQAQTTCTDVCQPILDTPSGPSATSDQVDSCRDQLANCIASNCATGPGGITEPSSPSCQAACGDIQANCVNNAREANRQANYQSCMSSCQASQDDPTSVPLEALPTNDSAAEQTGGTRFNDIVKNGLIQNDLDPECRSKGKCDLDDVMQIFVNIQVFLFGITGSILLLVFIIGGFTWMTSNGNMGRVQKGLDTMRDAIIGLIIVMSAYAIVNIVINVLTDEDGDFNANPTLEETINDATAERNDDGTIKTRSNAGSELINTVNE